MENAFILITGTSRGIGEMLAQKLLEQGNTVLGVSRNRSDLLTSEHYHHLSFDLTDTSVIDRILVKAAQIIDQQSHDFLCLVNNASMLEPLGAIEDCSFSEIEAHIRVGLIAPMILTSGFIRDFSDRNARKKIAFVSSGAGNNPILGGSAYSTAKAGINMFTRAVGLEQQSIENGFEVVAFSPGMVETSMQKTIRSKTSQEFASADRFKQAKQMGRVQERSEIMDRLIALIEDHQENGQFIHL